MNAYEAFSLCYLSAVASIWYQPFSIYLQLQALLVSGGSDGLLILWNADQGTDSRDLVPKLSLKVFISILTFHAKIRQIWLQLRTYHHYS